MEMLYFFFIGFFWTTFTYVSGNLLYREKYHGCHQCFSYWKDTRRKEKETKVTEVEVARVNKEEHERRKKSPHSRNRKKVTF